MDATDIPRPLITSRELLTWLGVSKQWLNDRLADPDFPRIDLAPKGAPRRTLRFEVHAIAAYLNMPVPPRETTRTAA